MNLCPISETERDKLRAEHRERVRRCTIDLQKRYVEQADVEAQRKAEEEYENEGGQAND